MQSLMVEAHLPCSAARESVNRADFDELKNLLFLLLSALHNRTFAIQMKEKIVSGAREKIFQFLSITIITNLFPTLLLVAELNRLPFQRKKFSSPRLANWNNWQWWMDSLLNNSCIIWITIAKRGNISNRNLFYSFLRMSQNLLRWRQTSFSVGLGKNEW